MLIFARPPSDPAPEFEPGLNLGSNPPPPVPCSFFSPDLFHMLMSFWLVKPFAIFTDSASPVGSQNGRISEKFASRGYPSLFYLVEIPS